MKNQALYKPPQFWSGPYAGQHAPHVAYQPVLQVEGVVVRYEGVTALEGISFALQAGERVAVVGPNGAGKSTLLKVIAGVIAPTQGAIRVYGSAPGGHLCIAYVPQRSQVDWRFPVTVADAVMMGRAGKLGLLRWPSARDWAYVYECLERVGMKALAKRQIGELSGGQQQRMFIARALAQEAELMLLDEPLTGLDVPAQTEILHILDGLKDQRVTVLLSTHDLQQAAQAFDRVILLNRRLISFGPPDEALTPQTLEQAYLGQLRLIYAGQGLTVVGDTCCEGHHD